MIYKIDEKLEEIKGSDISAETLTVGIITSEELEKIGPFLGLDFDTVEASRKANTRFRTGVEVRDTYTFAELRLIDSSGNDDFISIFLKKNLLLVVEIIDRDKSTERCLLDSLNRRAGNEKSLEKLICYFVEDLLRDGNKFAETLQDELSELEESIVKGNADEKLNEHLLGIKKRIRKYHSLYGQMQDIFETLQDNHNEIFNEKRLVHISNMVSRISRTREDISSLGSFADHIQDAYSSLMDQRLNNTMKRITVLTTIFFPLTIIVGWYGMNFKYMPELNWRYGYLCVVVLSVIVIAILLFIGKKRKWF